MTNIRSKLPLGLLIAVLALGAVAAGSTAADAAENPCFSNAICAYGGIEYNQILNSWDCSSSGTKNAAFGSVWQSAKNRCGNKTNWLRRGGTVIACMNPGGNRPNPGSFNEVFIAASYGAFC
jgi:hypothetical protein